MVEAVTGMMVAGMAVAGMAVVTLDGTGELAAAAMALLLVLPQAAAFCLLMDPAVALQQCPALLALQVALVLMAQELALALLALALLALALAPPVLVPLALELELPELALALPALALALLVLELALLVLQPLALALAPQHLLLHHLQDQLPLHLQQQTALLTRPWAAVHSVS
jgi:hypothetical protein